MLREDLLGKRVNVFVMGSGFKSKTVTVLKKISRSKNTNAIRLVFENGTVFLLDPVMTSFTSDKIVQSSGGLIVMVSFVE